MLKTTLDINNNIKIYKYDKLTLFMKIQSKGYEAKKSKVLTASQIKTFFNEAEDNQHLLTKVTHQIYCDVTFFDVRHRGQSTRPRMVRGPASPRISERERERAANFSVVYERFASAPISFLYYGRVGGLRGRVLIRSTRSRGRRSQPYRRGGRRSGLWSETGAEPG